MQMINFLHESHLLVDFDDAHREFSRFVELEMSKPPRFYRQSSAGWWIYANLDAETIVRFCGDLAKHCGLSDDEWSFTYE